MSNVEEVTLHSFDWRAVPAVLRSHGFLIGAGIIWCAPAVIPLARRYWTTAQGAQGPIIVALGIWATAHLYRRHAHLARPGVAAIAIAGILLATAIAIGARLVGMLPLQVFAAVAGIVAALYGFVGHRLLQRLWLPLTLLLAAVPLPYFAEQALTAALKLKIAQWSVGTLAALGFDVANSGNALYIDQYELMIDAACSGLNSIVSLAVVGLFYVYWQRSSNGMRTLALSAMVVPIAIACNFVRVSLILVLVHNFGDRPLETALHPAIGIAMFVIALGMIIGLDQASRLRFQRRSLSLA